MPVPVQLTLFEPVFEAIVDAAAERATERVLEQLAGQLSFGASPYLTVPEAADYLRAPSRQRVDDLLTAGKLSRVKEGGRTLIRRAELEAYIERGSVSPARRRRAA